MKRRAGTTNISFINRRTSGIFILYIKIALALSVTSRTTKKLISDILLGNEGDMLLFKISRLKYYSAYAGKYSLHHQSSGEEICPQTHGKAPKL